MKARPPQDPRASNGRDAREPRASRPKRGQFSRPLNVHNVKDDGLVVTLEAMPEDLAEIAEAVKLPSVRRLKVRYRIKRRSGGCYDVSGDLEATVTQVCVVTLEPFESDISNEIDLAFVLPIHAADMPGLDRRFKEAPRGDKRPDRGPAPVPGSDDQEDPADLIVDDTIDLGAIALEFLTLGCDLYPRKPGVQFSDTSMSDNAEPDPSAFAALGRLKDRS